MKKLSVFLALVLFALTACEKSVEPGSAYYPNSTGNFWQYKVTNLLKNTTFNVSVTIEGDTMIDSVTYKLWRYRYPDQEQTVLVRVNNDSICMYDVYSAQQVDLENVLLTPWRNGKEWGIKGRTDTYEIQGISSIKTELTTFKSVSRIIKRNNLPNDMGYTEYDMKPYVGMVKAHFYDYYLGIVAKDDIWELIDYSFSDNSSER